MRYFAENKDFSSFVNFPRTKYLTFEAIFRWESVQMKSYLPDNLIREIAIHSMGSHCDPSGTKSLFKPAEHRTPFVNRAATILSLSL